MMQELEILIRRAGELAKQKTLSAQVHIKAASDFVTDADLAVSRFLMEELVRLVPDSHVLSEEDTCADSLEGRLFIVDPVDGTTNLMYRLGLSAISCGYAENGELLAGVIYNPFTDEMFTAEKGKRRTAKRQTDSCQCRSRDARCADRHGGRAGDVFKAGFLPAKGGRNVWSVPWRAPDGFCGA